MKFKQLKLLLEAFSNWEYKIPEDRAELLFDFYMLVNLGTPTDEKLKTSLTDAVWKIMKYLKPNLLDCVFYAVCCEIRHLSFTKEYDELWDQILNDSDNSNIDEALFYRRFADQMSSRMVRKFKGKGDIKNIELFLKEFISDTHKFLKNIPKEKQYTDRYISDKHSGNIPSRIDTYKKVNMIINKLGMSREECMEILQRIFLDLKWETEYGGQKWADICKGWLMLSRANENSYVEMVATIDHVYHLQHNNGTVFNKLKSYYNEKTQYTWVKKALDKRANMKSLFEIYKDISVGLRRFAAAVIYNTTGQTLEAFLNNSTSINKSKGFKNDWEWEKKHQLLNINTNIAWENFEKSNYKIWDGKNKWAWPLPTWPHKYEKFNPIWKSGVWEDGTWNNGTWESGMWQKGIWEDGIWENGTWENGIWKNGNWEDGTWNNGTWEDGNWNNGNWYYGLWKNGHWDFGTWYNGTWENGTWKNGMWYNGEWKSGEWVAGLIYDPNKKGNFKNDWNWNKDGFVRSPINPKEYFEGIK
jgi:hypothetical protein